MTAMFTAEGDPKKNAAAVELGRMGGKTRTKKKASAVRENGKLGGRPRKKAQ